MDPNAVQVQTNVRRRRYLIVVAMLALAVAAVPFMSGTSYAAHCTYGMVHDTTATTPATDPCAANTGSTNVTSSVTPYFNGLGDQALDLIPLALTVIGIGVAFRLVVGWFHRAG